MRAIDILGHKFGMLTVIERIDQGRSVSWMVSCNCGKSFITKRKNLVSSRLVSCPDCSRHNDISGNVYGRLKVLERSGSDKIQCSVWKCECVCGNITYVAKSHLNNGATKSCGCLKIEKLKKGLKSGHFKKDSVWRTKEYYRDWKRNKRKSDPIYNLSNRISSVIRKSLKDVNSVKDFRSFEMLGYSKNDLFVHIEKCFLKGMSWENMNEWHIDHIIPISCAKSRDDVLELNQLYNLRPLWIKENLSKGSKRKYLI